MLWIAPSEKDAGTTTLEKRLWDAADQFRANSDLKASEYSQPILGLIFLRFAGVRFAAQRARLEKSAASSRRGSRVDDPAAYHAEGVLYLPPDARFDHLLSLPEAADIGKAVNEAMREIEKHNDQLSGVLPRSYNRFTSKLLSEILKMISEIPATLDYDAFGRIYEYFLGEFARTEGQGGGEFYTPSAIVRLLTEVIEPYHGRILDPACGSGGMFVSSARFVAEHKHNPSAELSIHGVEKTDETGRLCRMNLAVHGLEGTIKHGGNVNTYYDDPHAATGKFDFVLANPPFNVDAVDKERLKDAVGPNRRFPFGLPRVDNANYLWIQLFYSALNDKGRAGFVMANSASDARSSEQEIRRELIEAGAVDVMVAVGPNMFYTVTLPCTLWFFDRGKAATPRADTVLFLDARHIYRQIDRAHREWTPAQTGFLANLVRLYRGEALDYTFGGAEAEDKIKEVFGKKPRYEDVPGLCKVATRKEIEAQGWSLNPGRYVGVAPGEEISDEDFKEKLEELNEELETLNAQARELEATIARNVAEILGA
ncbi:MULTISPECIES: class I SAM-dependent DNA methyltransferase [Acidobacterium]|uniref:site-specific DNA-methyltransferase (adenine-specific) n=1 Tax=Acidobacterium capsulatum (strain ATCC 51196 / DSM 11244 / BCRC 80197 / JCM 7670 / NBRC 15755 / NCIMB 13165 / 161) TaxID=240015 RepID=C1F6N0_ACIC5|nr:MULTISPECIES: class I SAM-dependent DNA methyltransferase [Acidobacterium]ACO33667.1 putative type I restriction-modification system, M subunit [Acidobacterium capsulatum ATCC 51196]HCT60922.1 SAM-dependent DNA methyltransferase [Acidobacterium sp.]